MVSAAVASRTAPVVLEDEREEVLRQVVASLRLLVCLLQRLVVCLRRRLDAGKDEVQHLFLAVERAPPLRPSVRDELP